VHEVVARTLLEPVLRRDEAGDLVGELRGTTTMPSTSATTTSPRETRSPAQTTGSPWSETRARARVSSGDMPRLNTG
jgi:hypothetical protein